MILYMLLLATTLIPTHCLTLSNIPNLPLHGKSFFLTRSQVRNAARDLSDWHPNFPYICDTDTWMVFSVAPEYLHSFRPDDIASYFFGTPYLHISGSKVPDRGAYDILADYFGLGQTFRSNIKLEPVSRNALADFSFRAGRGRWYLHAQTAVVWAKNNIHIAECITDDGLQTPFDALYMATQPVTPVVSSFCQAIGAGAVYGEVTEPILFGKIGCPNALTKCTEIQAAVGWIFLERPNGWMSVNLRGSIPTGPRPNSRYLFEAIIGNGHHGELGLGFYGQGLLWEKDGDKQISLWLEANFTHLFSDRQCRSFDLLDVCDTCCDAAPVENGFGSRYILTKEFDESGAYTQQTVPLINRTTLPANVSIDFEMDIAVMFAFEWYNWSVNLGYDGWLRTRERISLDGCFPCDTYGLKGIQNVTLQMGGPSDATQSKATLHGDPFAAQALVVDANPPVFVSQAQIDTQSAASGRMFTNKIFTHVQHSWHRTDPCALQPFIGLGFEVEFEGRRPKYLQPNKLAMSQWGVWLKTGIGY